MRPRRRRGPGATGWALLAVLAVLAAGCDEVVPQNALDPAGPVARQQDRLWQLVFPIAVAIFVLVQGAIIYALIRFRAKGRDDAAPKQVAGNTRLELLWTVIPALILAGVAVPTVGAIFALAQDPGDEALQVRVVAKQYWWEFEYLGEEGQGVVTANDLHIPTGRTVRLQMQSLASNIPDPGDGSGAALQAGVIHSFWVPQLAGKQDVVPGRTRIMSLEADGPGTYLGQCAEFCGLGHAWMRFRVIAQEPGEFDDWLAQQAQPAEADLTGLAAQGEEAFGVHCIQCHALDGHPQNADIRIGPDLTHFADREVFTGALVDNDDDNLAAWLRNPPEFKPGAQMPNLNLSDEEIESLVAYLRSLD